jgi:quercetin dioxygenase-like cupin family protein
MARPDSLLCSCVVFFKWGLELRHQRAERKLASSGPPVVILLTVMGETVKTTRIAAAAAPAVESAGEWGSAVWLANKALTGSSISVLRMVLHPRHSGRQHRHGNADEVLYLIRGQVRVRAGDEMQALQPGDSLSIPAGLIHQIENVGSDNAEMTIAYSMGDRAYE